MSDKMNNQKSKSMISLGRKALSVAVASSLLLMAEAGATGLGKITVLSALGQPLRAEIELTSPNKDEIDSLVPKLAPIEAFKQANIDLNPALLNLRFAVEQRAGKYVIKVSSAQPLNEPFVDMLVELNSSNGKLMREYTFLLDPVELRNSQSPQANNSAPAQVRPGAAQPTANVRPVAPAMPATSAKPASQAAAAKPEMKSTGDYQVKTGDTLSKIANAHKIEGISLDQMLVGIYRANPDAFVGGNMNRLKSGQILNIPDSESIQSQAGDAKQAHGVVMAHANDFNSYRSKLAEHVERAPAAKDAGNKQSSSGAISAKVKELPTASNEATDKLKLSKAGTNDKKGASDEERIAKDKALADANNRLKELEKNVGDLQKLLELKNKDLAAKQAELSNKDVATKSAAVAPAASKPASSPVVASASAAAPVTAPAAVASQAAAAASVAAEAKPAEASASASASAAASAVAAASVAKPKRRVVAPPPPPPEPSLMDTLSDYMLPIGAVALALLGGLGFWATKRKKKLQQFEDSILTGSSMKANSMFGSTGGQSVDTNNSVFNSNFAPSASQLDANEVDPVAEADVYIAYGRDTQAEEILKEALRTQPDRQAVRLKLLEIYYARKDTKAFERMAGELYGMTSGTGDEWEQAASMGIVLDPNNPLYAGGKAKDDIAPNSAMGSGTQPLEDLDPEALLANSLSQDMLEAISIIDTAAKSDKTKNTEAAAELTADDPHLLDFDLDISTGSEVPAESGATEAPVIEEPVTAKASEPDFGTIDFDFTTKTELPVASAPESESVKAEDDLGLDFSVLEQVEATPLQEMPVVESDAGLSISLDLPEVAASPAVEPEISLDLSASVEESAAAEIEPASSFDFDLSGIDLNLDSALPSHATDAAVEEAPAHNAEMATKLDLAVAYHEIGDKEGAKELLDEVVKGGTVEQIERARVMLAEMA